MDKISEIKPDWTATFDYCPVCGEKYVLRARCMQMETHCNNGHVWHRCVPCKRTVMGEPIRRKRTDCTCDNYKGDEEDKVLDKKMDMFWEAVESNYVRHWDIYMRKVRNGVVVKLLVRPWDKMFRVVEDGEVIYEGKSRLAVEKHLSG